jgi:hypothetical protein
VSYVARFLGASSGMMRSMIGCFALYASLRGALLRWDDAWDDSPWMLRLGFVA